MSEIWNETIVWSDNILSNFKYMILKKLDEITIGSCTFRSLHYKYGRIHMGIEGIKLFVLSSMIPLEPDLTVLEVDTILFQLCFLDVHTYLSIVIEGIEEKLEFRLNPSDKLFPFLQKIIYGEIKLKSKYLSKILVYKQVDLRETPEGWNLVLLGEDPFDKIYIVPQKKCLNNDSIGHFSGDINFLNNICSRPHKVNDVYFHVKAKSN
ncbi:hypothetical protein Anas_13467 [Armadillidium nasatum]|uniref:Uncharacterized protein n=1 Tax=Armadillidium nasatum TaxID=96803 RepID=A0A5N5SQG5_9CRUS|nr:hypothetical protein Anas_13467 [Armadillidium nasatum]